MFERVLNNTNSHFDDPTPTNYKHLTLPNTSIKLPRIKIFKTSFRKLLVCQNSGNDAYGRGLADGGGGVILFASL